MSKLQDILKNASHIFQGMLIRGADDFLYMTTSKELAQKFLALINDGFPNYGCNFNKTKTQTNLIGKEHILNIMIKDCV